jgi:6-phosphogluconate dehydrogenase
MVRRLLRQGHQCVVYGRQAGAVEALVAEGAVGIFSHPEVINRLEAPQIVWLMIPAAAVDGMIAELTPLLAPGDILIDGSTSHDHDDIRRSTALRAQGISYLDVGTSGGVWGLEGGHESE